MMLMQLNNVFTVYVIANDIQFLLARSNLRISEALKIFE